MRAWSASIALPVALIAATIFVSAWYLERVQGWDRTARFAAMPGAFAPIVVIAARATPSRP
jgi:uncharacterized membrane protein AbrB (regulator of aidB expression)